MAILTWLYGNTCQCRIANITKQKSTKDCDLYAIAIAVLLTKKCDPEKITMVQER